MIGLKGCGVGLVAAVVLARGSVAKAVAMVFLGAQDSKLVLTGKLVSLLGSRGNNWEILTAGAFITIVVPLTVFFALQRYFVRGLLGPLLTDPSIQLVKATYDRMLAEDSVSPQAFNYATIDTVEAVDDTTVVFHFKAAHSDALADFLEWQPMPKHLLEGVAPASMRNRAGVRPTSSPSA